MSRFRKPSPRRSVEMAAALLIPVLVVGIPFLTNYSRGKPASGVIAAGRPASETPTDAPHTESALPSMIGADGEIVELAVDGFSTEPTSTFWDLYQRAVDGAGVPAAAPPPPGSSTTSTTGATTTPARPSTPTSTTTPTPTPTPTSPPPPPTTTTPPPTVKRVTVPQAPANMASDFGSPSLNVRWDAVSSNTDGTAFVDFEAYEISVGARGLSKAYQTTGTSFTYTFGQNEIDFGVPQPELTVTVRAVAASGSRSGPLTGVATNVVPATPTAPADLISDSAHVTVLLPNQGGFGDLAGFAIYHSESASGPFGLLASTDGYDPFEHAVLTGTTHHYLYKIRDVFGQLSPGFSPTATASATAATTTTTT